MCSWASAQAPAPIEVRWSDTPALKWSGIAASEPAGTTASFLYPAPNAGGLIAAILTHSLLVNGSRESERLARQTAADQVLEHYKAAIDRLDAERLTEVLQSLRTSDPSAQVGARRLVRLQPHFRVSTDHRVIVLDAQIRLHEADPPSGRPASDTVVQVVSTPRDGEDPLAAWLANDAVLFREEVVTMLTHAIDIAFRAAPLSNATPARTQRYAFGNETRMERGQPFTSGCGRVVLWTLRESWMSVPLIPSDPTTCPNRYTVATP